MLSKLLLTKRRLLLILLFISLHTRGISQTVELDSVLRHVEYQDDSIQSIFNWVTSEISYDTQRLLLDIPTSLAGYGSPTNEIIRETIKNRKGVCQHYAELFNALLRRAGIESYVIGGYVRNPGINDREGHAWNVVRSKDGWYFYDPTWAAGYVHQLNFIKRFDSSWYKVPPEEFIKTHIPIDPLWQFLKNPVTHQQVKNNTYPSQLENGNYPIDHISKELALPEEEQLSAAINRIKTSGTPLRLINRYLEVIEYNYYIILFNKASSALSSAINDYNIYASAKNRYFTKPKWSDEQLKSFPNTVKAKINTSKAYLDLIQTKEPHMAQYKDESRREIKSLIDLVNKETLFIDKYLATWKPVRTYIFLK